MTQNSEQLSQMPVGDEVRSDWKPVAVAERIEALDVVRGFALIGICLMNIEFFQSCGFGLRPRDASKLEGIDWLASYFVAYFVAGKFWTIFSLLFGYGFRSDVDTKRGQGTEIHRPLHPPHSCTRNFGVAHHI